MADLDVKRIINFTTQSTLSDGDYVAVDSTGNGTKKYNLGGLLQPATTSTPGLMSSQDKAALAQVQDDVTDLKGDFNKLIDDTIEIVKGKNICPPVFEDGYINASGVITPYSDWETTELIDVSGLSAVVASGARANNSREAITMHFLTTYNSSKTRIEQISNPSTTYAIGENVSYIRFSIHANDFHDIQVESGTTKTDYEPYSVTYRAVNDEYALESDVDEIEETVARIGDKVNETIVEDYQLYNANFSLSPSAIWDDGNLISTLDGTKTTTYIDCSSWRSIRYTGANWLGCRALAFYDETQNWITSMPVIGNTTYYTNEIVQIPLNAKYVIFADLTAKVTQTLRIEVATDYKIVGRWAGKKWTCVGDSLTESNLRTSMNYHDYIAQKTGITVVNMGKSGTGYMRTYDEGFAFYQRISNVPTDSDVVTIFGSGNDLLYIDDLGTPTDSGTSTICGCINETIDNLIDIMPAVQLGIVAPTPWINNQPTLDDSNSMGQYVKALKQICYIRSIPFLDLYHESNLRPWTAEGRAACYSKDEGNGVHPDETGHFLIASRFEGFLDSLLLAN